MQCAYFRVILTPFVHRAWNSQGNQMGNSPTTFAKRACLQGFRLGTRMVHRWEEGSTNDLDKECNQRTYSYIIA